MDHQVHEEDIVERGKPAERRGITGTEYPVVGRSRKRIKALAAEKAEGTGHVDGIRHQYHGSTPAGFQGERFGFFSRGIGCIESNDPGTVGTQQDGGFTGNGSLTFIPEN